MEEKRFVCKFCNKRFPCGKSLGGHIRTHMNEYSAHENGEKDNADLVKVASFDGGRKKKRDSAVSKADAAAAAGNSTYGLRENPQKTMRFVDSSSATAFEAKLCKECGKGFASLKALCGHMACHSDKDRGTNKFEDSSGVSGKDKFVMDSQSDTETSTPTLPRRSKRMMSFKNLNLQPSPSSLGNSSSLTMVELEQEEGAKLLLLLSKDSGHRGRLNSIADSSENNSVVLEVKSPSVDTKMTDSHVRNKQQYNGKLKLKSAEVAVSGDSNSEYFLSGYNKIESEVSGDGYPRNIDLKKLKVDSSEFEHLGSELGKGVNKIRVRNSESSKKIFKEKDFDQSEVTMRKEEKSYSFSPHRNTLSKKFVNGAAASEEGYELTDKNVNSGYESTTYESDDEQSTDSDSFSVPMRRGNKSLKQKHPSNSKKKMSGSKKNKGHECPICYRIFKSGQALGGHKRSHFLGGSEENTLVIKQDTSHVQCLIDLNLPAPVD